MAALMLESGVNVQADSNAALHSSAKAGHIDVVKLLLEAKADLNSTRPRGSQHILAIGNVSVLTEAAYNGQLEVVKLLLKKGARVGQAGEESLHAATTIGHEDIVKVLLEAGADINAFNDLSLRIAVTNGYMGVTKILLKFGANIHTASEWPLRMACYVGRVDIVEILLDAGADPNALHSEALRNSVIANNLDLAKLLLERGADVHVRNDSPLRSAAHMKHFDMIKLLVGCGANVHVSDDAPLRCATRSGRVDIVELLLRAGADVHAVDDALQQAAGEGRIDMVKLLLEAGAKVHELGGAALRKAVSGGHLDVADVLLSAGANVQFLDDDAIDFVLRAAQHGHIGIVRAWVNADKPVQIRDDIAGKLAAAGNGCGRVVEFLISAGTKIRTQGSSLLVWAARRNHLNLLTMWIQKGRGVGIDEGGDQALNLAASHGHVKIVKALLEAGANVQGGNEMALKQAALNGHIDVVEVLLRASVKEPKDAFVRAARDGSFALVDRWIQRGESTSFHGEMLMAAAEGGHVDVVRRLLEAGTKLEPGMVHSSASGQSHQVIKTLSKAGADVGIMFQEWGRLDVEIIKAILREGVRPIPEMTISLLGTAATGGDAELMALLLANADLDAVMGWVVDDALLQATSGGHVAVIQILMKKGGEGYMLLRRAAQHTREVDATRLSSLRKMVSAAGDGSAMDRELLRALSRRDVEMMRLVLAAGGDRFVAIRRAAILLKIESYGDQ
ncbi:hypothetical protein HDV00_011831 [Rhizophlyctis rosea]|nr:hypothetical protein HDV00_011831 [Rhizophlyctis rosea]